MNQGKVMKENPVWDRFERVEAWGVEENGWCFIPTTMKPDPGVVID